MLAELDKAKTAFFSNVSHEFRTPLTLMMSPLEIALNDPSALDRTTLEMVMRNGQRLMKLVNTLLDFSRIEAGRYVSASVTQFSSLLCSTALHFSKTYFFSFIQVHSKI